MGEGDYMRHVSAEKSIFSSDKNKDERERPTAPLENLKASGSNGGASARSQNGQGAKREAPPADADSHLKPFQEGTPDDGRVAATTSDEVAEKMWGSQQKADPEFFI